MTRVLFTYQIRTNQLAHYKFQKQQLKRVTNTNAHSIPLVESIATHTGIDTKILFGEREIQNLHLGGGAHTKIRHKHDFIDSLRQLQQVELGSQTVFSCLRT